MFQLDTPHTELLDLEDLYMPNIAEPAAKTIGTPNYQHPAGKDTWRSAGDRYATAVLASEVLLLSDVGKARCATDTGYYGGNRTVDEARQRFDEAQQWFQREAPEFGEALEAAWKSDSLLKCPRIAALRDSLDSVPAGEVVRVFTPSNIEEEPKIKWEKFPSKAADEAPVVWVQPTSENVEPPRLAWQAAHVQKSSRRALWVTIAIVALLILLFFLWPHMAHGSTSIQSLTTPSTHQHTSFGSLRMLRSKSFAALLVIFVEPIPR